MTGHGKRYRVIMEKLRSGGYKLTPQRMAIAEILAESRDHPSIENLYTRLKKDHPTMSLATVYRNVMLIKSLGEVLEVGLSDGSNRYDGNKPYPHPHVVCLGCRKIIEPELANLPSLIKEVVDETGFTDLTHQLTFSGICSDCANGQDK
jgi:Fur family peroxide stress response transcriptional regulator